jgi:hypothetical protein
MESSNRHPADRLADVRSELRRIGAEHVATIGEQQRKRVDLKALADEVGASILARFTSFKSAMIVRLRERDVEGRL